MVRSIMLGQKDGFNRFGPVFARLKNVIVEVAAHTRMARKRSVGFFHWFVMVGFLLGYISTHGILSQLGMFLGKGTLCSMAVVFFVLPGIMYLLDGLIRRTTWHADFLKKGDALNEKA